MKKAFKIIGLSILGIGIILGITMWLSMRKHNKAQAIADRVIENLLNEDIYKEFPEKYFQKEQLEPIIGGLKQNCNWQNRDGKFVDFFSHKRIGRIDQTAFIYEYYLNCDSLRFILSMNMENNPELMGFNVEPLENKNPMILFPRKQLKYRKK